jgi:phosphohistidine phosphatase
MPAGIRGQLLLMRHGKSGWPEGIADFNRPLAARGRRDARKMGAWLAHQGLIPECIISSPALRARDTALQVAAALGLESDSIHWDPAVYEASVAGLCHVIERHAGGRTRLMVVGHNPALDGLVRLLSNEEPPLTASGKLMTTAAVAILSYATAISTDRHAASPRLIRPKQLS